jgi:hypothetical protein
MILNVMILSGLIGVEWQDDQVQPQSSQGFTLSSLRDAHRIVLVDK